MTDFLAQFQMQFGTDPAATALIVATSVPQGDAPVARSTGPESIDVGDIPYVPPAASFSDAVAALLEPPVQEVSSNAARLAGDWRPTQANYYITDYDGPNRVSISSSYRWVNGDAPSHLPQHWGIEFEVNLYGNNVNTGLRPSCFLTSNGLRDPYYKQRMAAQNQNWNWQVIRPDGQTAPSTLGAYADYNDLGDSCNKASFAIGLRYPQNIQYVNQGWGIVFLIDAPKGMAAESLVQAGTQAVYDGFCNVWPYSLGPKTDCMGVTAGTWPLSVAQATTTLGTNRGRTGPNECWFTDTKVLWVDGVDPVQYRNDECPEW